MMVGNMKPEALSSSSHLQPAVGVVLVLRQKVAHIDLMVKYILVDREMSHLTKSFPSPRLRLVFIMAFIHRSQVAWIHIMSPQICALLICLHIQLHIQLHIEVHAGAWDAWQAGVSLRKLGISICCANSPPTLTSFCSADGKIRQN